MSDLAGNCATDIPPLSFALLSSGVKYSTASAHVDLQDPEQKLQVAHQVLSVGWKEKVSRKQEVLQETGR